MIHLHGWLIKHNTAEELPACSKSYEIAERGKLSLTCDLTLLSVFEKALQ